MMIAWLSTTFNSNVSRKIKKLMDEKSKEASFQNYSTFDSSSGLLRIDENDGRAAQRDRFM
ncbi:MAG: hypothetical protein PUA62_00635 [Lachnospiraceae bacterium]|nr:hypothetical protein [Lachnospiraceae bacterium]